VVFQGLALCKRYLQKSGALLPFRHDDFRLCAGIDGRADARRSGGGIEGRRSRARVPRDGERVASAAWLLKMRAHAKKYGDSGPTIIRVAGGFPDEFR
jgi:hypothetical protein